jgi:hypothetical protein
MANNDKPPRAGHHIPVERIPPADPLRSGIVDPPLPLRTETTKPLSSEPKIIGETQPTTFDGDFKRDVHVGVVGIEPEAGQVKLNATAPTVTIDGVKIIIQPGRQPIRDHAEEAETLTRHLARQMQEEVNRLKAERRNDQGITDFFEAAIEALNKIADEIAAAKAASGEEKSKLFAKAEASVRALASVAGEFVSRHRDRLVDFSGNMSVVGFATILFTLIGVSPDLSIVAVMAMYGLPIRK